MKVCVGGTFEFLHLGHQALLSKAMELAGTLVIGLTSDDFMFRARGYSTPFEERKRVLDAYVRYNFDGDFVIDRLDEPYGPSVTEGFEAIVVSEETAPTALRINEVRRERGLPELEVIVVMMVPADDGLPIHSTRIRKGEIDLEGHLL